MPVNKISCSNCSQQNPWDLIRTQDEYLRSAGTGYLGRIAA